MDYKKLPARLREPGDFIKTTAKPAIDGPQKAALNRKGNLLYNQGRIEEARRVFLTTGYSDGLVRIGDYYKSQGRLLDALRMYWIAPDRKKSAPVILELSLLIKDLIREDTEEESSE